jgi:hypothetical protein
MFPATGNGVYASSEANSADNQQHQWRRPAAANIEPNDRLGNKSLRSAFHKIWYKIFQE